MTLRSFSVTHKIKEEQSQSLNYSLPRIMKKDTIIRQGEKNFPISISITESLPLSTVIPGDSSVTQGPCNHMVMLGAVVRSCCNDWLRSQVWIDLFWMRRSECNERSPTHKPFWGMSISINRIWTEKRMEQKHKQWKGKSVLVLTKLCELELRGKTPKGPCHCSTPTSSPLKHLILLFW